MRFLTQDKALIFRIVHVDNVPWILANGIHARSSAQQDPHYHEIGSPELIAKRSPRVVPIPPGGTLSDYVPFYFTPSSPMLLNVKTGFNVPRVPMDDIVVLISSLPTLRQQSVPFVFTDRHAYLEAACFSDDLSDLRRIDWPLLQARDFKRDPDDPAKFERYQAEALIHRHMAVATLLALACCGTSPQARLAAALGAVGVSLEVVVRQEWFF